MPDAVLPGDLLWSPSSESVEAARITHFTRWLNNNRGLSFSNYRELQRWSVGDLPAFWSAIWEYFGVWSDSPYDCVVDRLDVFGARWFVGSRTNYAEHLLRHERQAADDEIALFHCAETRPLIGMTWRELGDRVRALATALRDIGIVPGDRIVSYMPNIVETAIAMMATVAIGAIWSSAAPEFGASAVIERFAQVSPRLIFMADGYSFNGRRFDRSVENNAIIAGLPTLNWVVTTDFLGLGCKVSADVTHLEMHDLLRGRAMPAEEFRFERVPHDHPLWVLYSSGTTGLPKAIVHGHVGMIVEHLKIMALHNNLSPGQRMFFYTTTGWMMWNSVLAALIAGASGVLYDGSPTAQGPDTLWSLASRTKTNLFGASPTFVQMMDRTGLVPGKDHELDELRGVLLGGSPATADTFGWLYRNVKSDLWVTSQSGGTELCSGLAVGVPTLPVRAGEIQGAALGIGVEVWDDAGRRVVGEQGELIVNAPAPSMPLRFWNDDGDRRYRESYFGTFPGTWRHGDRALMTPEGGIYVNGRSDSTLNRFGVRIGSAEVYRIVDDVKGVTGSLIICCELPDGGYYMPLFISLDDDGQLTDGMRETICRRLRSEASPRHVPDEIHVVPSIPLTLTGKRMEVPVRNLIGGMPEAKAISKDVMADPVSIEWFIAFAKSRSCVTDVQQDEGQDENEVRSM